MNNAVTRRSFLGLTAIAGAAAATAGLAGCSPKKDSSSAKESDESQDKATQIEKIDESKITDTKECDVVVAGLGISGVAAFRAAAEGGMNVIAIEKSSIPNCRSQGIAGFNSELTRKLGVPEVDPMEIANELMIQMAHRADYRIVTKWLKHSGEALDWYLGAYDGLVLVGPDDEEPEDPEQIYAYAGSASPGVYDPSVDHERTWDAGVLIGGGDETHRPILEANIETALATGHAEAVYDSPAVQLDTENGRVTAIVAHNLKDDTYTRYKVKQGVILATGGYSYNEDMLKQYAPWVYNNRDKYLFAHEARDLKGNPSDVGDGQRLGMSVGGHVDNGPHAVMAHIYQFGAEQFVEVNEHGERFCNEDLSMTNIAKIFTNQPGTKIFQILDANADEYNPGIEDTMAYIRGDDGEGFSAEADTLEELAEQLGFEGEFKQNFLDSIARYNELCAAGHDDDFGKSSTKMHPIATAPFKAITYDSSKHTSVDDVSCLRLLVTMGGLVTNDNAQVLDDDSNPIGGLYAVGNTQGGRFVEDYPFTLGGASHAAALTYGYLAGHHIAENA